MRRSVLKVNSSPNNRLHYLAIGLFLFGGVLIWRLASLQVWGAGDLRDKALKQYSTIRELPAERGKIFYSERKSSELYPLATNRVYNHLFAAPRDVKNASTTMEKLWPLISQYETTEETLQARLTKENDIYEPLVHKLTDEALKPIMDLKLDGITTERETWRFYPEGKTLAHVLGFVGASNEKRQGQYGLEGYFEDELAGKDGRVEGDVDITGRLIQTGNLKRVEPESGVDLVLTIDRIIQAFACQKLTEQAERLGADSGDLIVMDPKTGAIIAMCSTPTFDPNEYQKAKDISVYLNPSAAFAYEPGSIFKAITMAAAIDSGKVGPETTYTDTGEVRYGTYTIKNSDNKAHGLTSMVGVLENSLNTGAIFAGEQLGKDDFLSYIKKFGFGKFTGIELGHETGGNINPLSKGKDINFATASYGQGITTTPLQMIVAYAALANGGKLMRPYIIKTKRRDDKVIETTKPEVLGQPISLRTSTIISGMLVSVVRNGHAKRAGVAGYRIGAKTGTAQVAEGGGYGNKYIHTATGYGPIDNPAFVMLVKLNDPKAGQFAESTAVPVFGDVARFILQYYEIPPDENI